MLKLMASTIVNTNLHPKKRNNPKENDFLPKDRSVYANFHQILIHLTSLNYIIPFLLNLWNLYYTHIVTIHSGSLYIFLMFTIT